MSYYPEVTVEEITEKRDKLVSTNAPKDVDLGGRHNFQAALAESHFDRLRQAIRQKEARVFLLTWQGNKVPRGVNLLGHIIAWTQHGMVTSKGGKTVGTYDRVVEFGGDTGKEQKMLVYLQAPPLETAIQ